MNLVSWRSRLRRTTSSWSFLRAAHSASNSFLGGFTVSLRYLIILRLLGLSDSLSFILPFWPDCIRDSSVCSRLLGFCLLLVLGSAFESRRRRNSLVQWGVRPPGWREDSLSLSTGVSSVLSPVAPTGFFAGWEAIARGMQVSARMRWAMAHSIQALHPRSAAECTSLQLTHLRVLARHLEVLWPEESHVGQVSCLALQSRFRRPNLWHL